MTITTRCAVLLSVVIPWGCTPQDNEVSIYTNAEFDGGRLSRWEQTGDAKYTAFIEPEADEVNNSPWFAFQLWSSSRTRIQLELIYPEGYSHRYIPKVSSDGIRWNPLDESRYVEDTVQGTLTIDLDLSIDTLWLAAQEIVTSSHINAWTDSLYAGKLLRETIGSSVEGKPIHLFSTEKRNQSIFIIGRQHPPEVPGGTLSLQAFVNALLADTEVAKTFREQYRVVFVPLMNPDGVDNGHWRVNAGGQDLNRDWVEFTQPETRAVRDWVKQELEPGSVRFAIDFHTSFSGPYLLVRDSLASDQMPMTADWIMRIEEQRGVHLDIRPRSQSLPYCYNWFINQVGSEAVTYEEGDEIDRKIIQQRAEDYANTLMTILSENI